MLGVLMVAQSGCRTRLHDFNLNSDGGDWSSDSGSSQGSTIFKKKLATSLAGSCAVRDGLVYCWGSDDWGQLGDAAPDVTLLPYQQLPHLVPMVVNAVEVTMGEFGTCSVDSGGSVTCWGAVPGMKALTSPPVTLAAPVGIDELSEGDFSACARIGGGVQCWGQNLLGQLGNGSHADQDHPADVLGLSDATRIVAGSFHVCALRREGKISCWGDGNEGQLGDGRTDFLAYHPVLQPVEVVDMNDAVDVAVGDFGTCAVHATGHVSCWGSNSRGSLGAGIDPSLNPVFPYMTSVPVPVVGLSDATAVTVGGAHSCALRANGQVVCWGDNGDGELGDGTTPYYLSGVYSMSDVPVTVMGISDAVEVSAGGSHTCARRATGAVYCWGRNLFGELGTPTKDLDASVPVAVKGFE